MHTVYQYKRINMSFRPFPSLSVAPRTYKRTMVPTLVKWSMVIEPHEGVELYGDAVEFEHARVHRAEGTELVLKRSFM